MLSASRRGRLVQRALWTGLVLSTFACGGDGRTPVVEGVIDRETFIEVYVELRAGAARNPDLTLPVEEREEILARHGVDEESLMAFVDAYGGDLDFMNELWAEVQTRMESLPAVPRADRRPGA